MAFIKLLILDEDGEYAFNLCTFLTHNYPETLLVSYYDNSDKIQECIKNIAPDIILLNEMFYNQINTIFQGNIIILSSGSNSMTLPDIPSIYKYIDANKIAGDVINIFTKSRNIITKSKERPVKIVAVYSAAGNTGKTSIALGISTICSYSGLSVFYINLEQFQSTGIFFSNDSEYSISDIIYYSKEKDKNFVSKIQTMSCRDATSGVCYFKASSNAFEMNELISHDIEFIIDNIKVSGQYDLIVVDMGIRLDESAIAIFELADEILYILTEEENCLHKTRLFIDSINMSSMQSTDNKSFYAEKLHYIFNKASNQALRYSDFLPESNSTSTIPFDQQFTSLRNLVKTNGGPELVYTAIKNIAQRYIGINK
jgi:MinD-like ATPase involved in chromosome partitioning or flagellar assembly